MDSRVDVLLCFAHIESHNEPANIQRMTGMLYEAIHRSHQHPDAWFAAYMCYRRVGMTKAADRAWLEACGRGNAQQYAEWAAKYH